MVEPALLKMGWRQSAEVATRAQVDQKTVRRWLAGKRIQPASLSRIERALRVMGLLDGKGDV